MGTVVGRIYPSPLMRSDVWGWTPFLLLFPFLILLLFLFFTLFVGHGPTVTDKVPDKSTGLFSPLDKQCQNPSDCNKQTFRKSDRGDKYYIQRSTNLSWSVSNLIDLSWPVSILCFEISVLSTLLFYSHKNLKAIQMIFLFPSHSFWTL